MINLKTADDAPFQHQFSFRHDDIEHTVYQNGSGPGVLLLHELPGMTKEFWRLTNWLAESFTVWAPDLFGNGKSPTPANPGRLLVRACISREIHLFSKNDPGPITQWLRSLSRALHTTVEGPGVGVIGMCMTGNFALTLALDPWVVAPVTSQPGVPASLPFLNQDGGLQLSVAEKNILATNEVDVMALRFDGDKLCRAARFEAIRSVIGDNRFRSHVIADEHRNPNGGLKHPHSVLTEDLIDDDDSVTKQKLLEVIGFLSDRLTSDD